MIVHHTIYCNICGGCGEDGCCSAVNCQQNTDGEYCLSYLDDLKFAYLMFNDVYDLIDKKHKEEFDRIYDKNYDIIYKK